MGFNSGFKGLRQNRINLFKTSVEIESEQKGGREGDSTRKFVVINE